MARVKSAAVAGAPAPPPGNAYLDGRGREGCCRRRCGHRGGRGGLGQRGDRGEASLGAVDGVRLSQPCLLDRLGVEHAALEEWTGERPPRAHGIPRRTRLLIFDAGVEGSDKEYTPNEGVHEGLAGTTQACRAVERRDRAPT